MSTPPITLDVDYPDHELDRTSTLLRGAHRRPREVPALVVRLQP
jgi:hypothetical protein